ncbi:hypothetical protein ABZY31_12805 [Streptomyces sp. NPDC006529]|uniref:hypothetical protein n=1 Tax=Streptomyces sp. NPDC006529 TaxID=3157177 RepID=UPI0033ABAC51
MTGAVFTVREWEGAPYNREPHTQTHSEPVWGDPAAPPLDCNPFAHSALARFATGRLYANVITPQLPGGETG